MSNARRARRVHLQPEQPIPQPTILRSFSDLQSGITTEPTQQVEVNIQAGAMNILQPETGIVISQSETPSEILERLPHIQLFGTPCCGYHVVNGFQDRTDDEFPPASFILGLAKAYTSNADYYHRIIAEQDEYNRKYNLENEGKSDEDRQPYNPPDQGCRFEPMKIAAMVVFIWNNKMYLDRAKALAVFIKDQGLGDCFFTEPCINPNSRAEIQAMTWCVKNKPYYKFIAEHTQPPKKDSL